jgi:hypothetical protein
MPHHEHIFDRITKKLSRSTSALMEIRNHSLKSRALHVNKYHNNQQSTIIPSLESLLSPSGIERTNRQKYERSKQLTPLQPSESSRSLRKKRKVTVVFSDLTSRDRKLLRSLRI